MAMGLVEALVVFLALSGFGVRENPRAPAAAEVLRYAPSQADFLIHLDLQAVLPGTRDLVNALPNHPAVKKNPQLSELARTLTNGLGTFLTMAQAELGVDPIDDLHSVTAWLSLSNPADPDLLVVLRGKLPPDLVDRLARLARVEPTRVRGQPTLVEPAGKLMIGRSADGALLVGTRTLVEARLGPWRPVKASGPLAREAARMLADKPFFLAASVPSKKTRARIEAALAADPQMGLLRDMALGHTAAVLTLRHDGIAWTWQSVRDTGHTRALMASRGLLDLMRAGHTATRGLARIVIAGLPSFAAADPLLATLAGHQQLLLDLVLSATGDGSFKADVVDDMAHRTVRVLATGKRLADVVPAGAVIPLVAAGMATYMLRRPAVRPDEKTPAPKPPGPGGDEAPEK